MVVARDPYNSRGGDRDSAMLRSPCLAVENAVKGNFQPPSILHSAEARRREASWEDCFLNGEETEPEPSQGGAS